MGGAYLRPGPYPISAPGHSAPWLKRLVVVGGAFVLFLALSTAGYYFIEDEYTCLDSVYMTVITIATVGYREIGDGLSGAGRVWTIFVILGGLVSGAAALSLIVAALVEGRLRDVLGRSQLERQVAAMSGHVIVCGYGHMGQTIVRDLTQGETDVVVVESDPERAEQAQSDGVACLLGDAQEDATLQSAGIERASALVSLLPTDAANVFLVLTARELNGSLRIISRALDATNADKLRKAGSTRVVCAQTIGANRIVDVLLRPAMVDFVERAHADVDLEMERLGLDAGSWMVGRTLRELALPPRIRAVVVAVRAADGTILYTPEPDTTLAAGDTLVLLGRRGAADTIRQLSPPAEPTAPPPAQT